MAERHEINMNLLDDVVGGAIVWKPNGTCYAKDDPDTVYNFDINNIDNILTYIRDHNGGRAQDANTLRMLRDAGYVW